MKPSLNHLSARRMVPLMVLGTLSLGALVALANPISGDLQSSVQSSYYNAYRTSRPACKAMVAPGRHRLLRSVPVRPPAPSPRVEDFDRRQRGRMIVVEQARAITHPPAASAPPITFSGCIRSSCWSDRAI